MEKQICIRLLDKDNDLIDFLDSNVEFNITDFFKRNLRKYITNNNKMKITDALLFSISFWGGFITVILGTVFDSNQLYILGLAVIGWTVYAYLKEKRNARVL